MRAPVREPVIAFEPVRRADLPLLADWLARPHWREWWSDPEEGLDQIRDMIDGRDGTRPFIFHVDGAPAGYIQVWYIGPHQTPDWIADHPWLAVLPSNAVGVDLALADPARLSQGIGTAVLRTFVARLRAQGHTIIIIDPDSANLRAVQCYRNAGFRPIPALEGKTEDLIMQHHAEPSPS